MGVLSLNEHHDDMAYQSEQEKVEECVCVCEREGVKCSRTFSIDIFLISIDSPLRYKQTQADILSLAIILTPGLALIYTHFLSHSTLS